MAPILDLLGLIVSFSGALILVKTAIKGEGELLSEAAPQLPTGGPPGSKEYEASLRSLPNVQALLRQSKVAKWGLRIIVIGFLIQLSGALVSLIWS